MNKQNTIILIVGKKGFGKTTLAMSLISGIKHPIFIFDALGEYKKFAKERDIIVSSSYELHAVLTSKKDLNRRKIFIDLGELNFATESPDCFKLIYLYQSQINENVKKLKVCTILVEEAWNFMTAHKIDHYFKAIALMGRHKGINSIVCSQRIANLNRNFYSQADHRFTFRQDDPHDIKVMSEYGINPERLINLKVHEKISF